jgi:uncharacterized OB-fold protein
MSSKQAEWQRRKVAAGLCSICGARPVTPGRVRCDACGRRNSLRTSARYHALKAGREEPA